MENPKVAVVILNWNGKKFLEQFLPSVVASTYPNLEIYVADNLSSDDSMEFVKTHFPVVKSIFNSDNLGFARGYNEALSKISADYFVLLNQDVEVTPGWIEPVIDLMEQDSYIGACQPKIRAYHYPDFFEYAGASGGMIDRYGYTFCRGRIFNMVERDKGQYEDARPVFWASGAALFIRAQLYHHVGGLDADFFAHMEEIDLCWRLQRMGYKIMVCPQSVVFHVGGGSLEHGNPKKVFLNYRNNLIMLYKNLNEKEKKSLLFVRMILDGIAASRSLFGGKTQEVKSIWHAHRGFYKWKKNYKKDTLPRPPFFDLSGVYKDSIVWQYFINRKKTYGSITKTKK